jgi:hypothetical protein
MPTLQLANFQEVGKNHLFTFANATPENVAAAFGQYMQTQGYKIEAGNHYSGTYGVGSTTMRILFGAFVKRYTFDFKIQPHGPNTLLELGKGMTGMSGGVIGMAKMNTEFTKLSMAVRTL